MLQIIHVISVSNLINEEINNKLSEQIRSFCCYTQFFHHLYICSRWVTTRFNIIFSDNLALFLLLFLFAAVFCLPTRTFFWINFDGFVFLNSSCFCFSYSEQRLARVETFEQKTCFADWLRRNVIASRAARFNWHLNRFNSVSNFRVRANQF
jgi:hypothetical protein